MVIINESVSHGDGDTIPEDLKEDYFPPNFKEYMLKQQLKWSRCKHDYLWLSGSGWVFWSEQDPQIEPSLSLDNCPGFNPNVCAIPKVRDNITRALQKLILVSPQLSSCLVQFWAATKTLEGRTKLTTLFQPFALGHTWSWSTIERQHLCEYRMKMCSSEYNNCFYADAESGEEQLGLPGRVFLHQFPEATPYVKYYSTKEYPQLDDARQCFIKGSWALPVFESSSKTCVGVLEMVSLDSLDSYWHKGSFLRKMHDIFQCRGDSSKREDALKELEMVFSSVCKIQELPLALTWIPCSACNDLIRGQFMSKALKYVEDTDEENVEDTDEENVEDTDEENVEDTDEENVEDTEEENIIVEDTEEEIIISEFLKMSKFTHLRKGGVSERAVSSPSMLYCPDITQLSIAEYPLVHYARRCKLSGLFTICLQSDYTEKEVYVVEFFLSTGSRDDENILTTLSLILGTMEENFETFKFASGQQLGEISSAEVLGFWNGQKLPFVQMIQAHRLSPCPELLKDRGLMSQLGQLDQPSTDAIHSGMNVISEEQNYILPSLQALQNGEATMQLDSPHQPPLDPSNYGHNGVTAEESITVVTSLQAGKRKTQRQNKGTGVRIEVSLDDILKCAKMKRKEAAEKLKVSESTFKRVCREHSIKRWPPQNMQNACPFQPSPDEIQGQTLQLNSEQQSNQVVPGVAHMKPGVQDANRVTIREKYKNKTKVSSVFLV